MVKNSDESGPSYHLSPSVRTAHASRSLSGAGSQSPNALNKTPSHNDSNVTAPGGPNVNSRNLHVDTIAFDTAQSHTFSGKPATNFSPPAAPPASDYVHGEAPTTIDTEATHRPNIFIRFYGVCKAILCASWINTLLVFVPVAIAVEIAGVSPTIVFAMCAVAIIPLAGLLSYATESVASEMGDTIGALMNVTFGNAVELIIFIALVKNEIRIVQASLLGSILANLLLILGMGFLVGGLRYREQVKKDFD
ncbi:MAG: hypothetical protein Q9166_005000 [cf. Caloplaca sp. 2 TL-2023]